ncbi:MULTISPECIES: hypothetical protein [Pseudomonas]|uniref:hypothetical protein n=1 Tax=Pseudomonas TaxID=286 RepID=UPI0021A553CF|nr:MULTISPECIES: hypothetical protein [Pseudomonas]UWS65535.1 hypothetical protein N0U38_17290 [Pseudomonas mosselii]WJN50060.1 hypothetical protein QUR91_26085 [Pseudomonas asiatica]
MDYRLHDVTQFPFVSLKASSCYPGYSSQWGAEMEALLDSNQPFVVAYEPGSSQETPEDYKARGLWLKQNKARFAGRCAAMIAIMPDASDREDFKKNAEKRTKGMGVTYCSAESFEAAAAQAAALIEAAEKSHS